MENEQTLQPPTETREKRSTEHTQPEETGKSIKQSQKLIARASKTEEVDHGGNSNNSQIIDRHEILPNSVDRSDKNLRSPRDDLETGEGVPKNANHSINENFPNSVAGSPSGSPGPDVGRAPTISEIFSNPVVSSQIMSPGFNPDVDVEAAHDPPRSPRWRSILYSAMEAIDLAVGVLAFVLEVAKIMINNNKALEFVLLGLALISCLATWTVFVWNARLENAGFSFGCFFLDNGQIYGSIGNYIESYLAIMQIILSTISIIFKFPERLIVVLLILSTAMISSKLTMRYNKCHSY